MRSGKCKFCKLCAYDKQKDIYVCFEDKDNPKEVRGLQSNQFCYVPDIEIYPKKQ